LTVSLADAWVDATHEALAPLADPDRAVAMRAYMKDVAPFLGVNAPDRRSAVRAAWADLPSLTTWQLAEVTRELWAMPEREYQYAACDLLTRYRRELPPSFLHDLLRDLLTDRPWWDTVDALGTAAVIPVVTAHPVLVATMWEWLRSDDRWLVRTAIQHQRGLRGATDLDRLYAMCDEVSADREFFVAKAVGWALRDAAAWDRDGVQRFLDDHPALPAVARREAVRGMSRAAG
jgi:3-methyladenine DNA glycosylase AlkD